jgi:hypothetical protein
LRTQERQWALREAATFLRLEAAALRAAVEPEARRALRSAMKALWATLAEWNFERGSPAL